MQNNRREIIKKEVVDLGEYIFKNPELGYKEFNTSKVICEKLQKYNIEYTDGLAITGIKATLDTGKEGPNIALLCELDSVPNKNHQYLGKDDYCAHNCGHYAQVGVMLGTFLELKELDYIKDFAGKITFIATPAEEYCDFEYREELIKQNKIKYIVGKQEMIHQGLFDDIDLVLSVHSRIKDQYIAELESTLNGFISKKITYKGVSSHAGVQPHEGINALSAANVALNAIGYLRETFREEDAVRVHYMITNGGTSANVIPDNVEIEMYVRAKTLDAIQIVNNKIDNALKAGALAIGCSVEIENRGGNLPLEQDKTTNDLVRRNILKFIDEDQIISNVHSFASADSGDLSQIVPLIQIGIAGFEGKFHGDDFRTYDTSLAYDFPIDYLIETVKDLMSNNAYEARKILKNQKTRITKEEYLQILNSINDKITFN